MTVHIMMYDKYDYDDDDDNLDVLLTDILILSYNCYVPCYFYLFYYSAILATTSVNAWLLACFFTQDDFSKLSLIQWLYTL